MSRSPARAASVSLPDVEALGVVGGHRAREHELRVGNSLAHDAERLDHADRVLPRVEPADLAHDRVGATSTPYCLASSWQNGIAAARGSSPRAGRCTAARARRASMSSDARARTPASSTPTRRTARRTGGRTPTPVGLASVRSMWQRQIHLVSCVRDAEALAQVARASPPAAGRASRRSRSRLRAAARCRAPSRGRCARICVRPLDVGALQRVVHGLGDGEELVAAVDHLPVGVDADARGAAARGWRAARRRRRRTRSRSRGARARPAAARPARGCGRRRPRLDDVRVVVEVLVEQRDAFEHGHSWVRPGAADLRSIYSQ